ncbi:hypothetical protein ABE021_10110 [Sporosarcina gallistercoris]|uniref:hypothetical protein n=1 Tax=Sporosarcina gallistercoris TaxID=2762245 RepID=UPI003D288192
MEEVKELAFRFDDAMGEFRGRVDHLDDLHSEWLDTSIEFEEASFELAQMKYEQMKRKVRLMETLLLHTKQGFESTFKELAELSDALSIEVLRNVSGNDTPQSADFSAAKVREKFVQEFGRAPQSVAEVGSWIEEIVSGKPLQEVE